VTRAVYAGTECREGISLIHIGKYSQADDLIFPCPYRSKKEGALVA